MRDDCWACLGVCEEAASSVEGRKRQKRGRSDLAGFIIISSKEDPSLPTPHTQNLLIFDPASMKSDMPYNTTMGHPPTIRLHSRVLQASGRSMSSRRQRAGKVLLIVFSLYVLYYRIAWASIFSFSTTAQMDRHQAHSLPHRYQGKYPHVPVNRTLGFQKIIALSLPERRNKRDEMVMMADATDIDIEFQDAVKGSDLVLKGLPAHDPQLRGQVMGCWRSHVDVWQRMVSEKIQSALILEDDIDWSVDIKEQLQTMQGPLATLVSSLRQDGFKRKPTPEHPYAGDWELLWIGQCLEESWSKVTDSPKKNVIRGQEPVVLYEDEHTPPADIWAERYQEMFTDYGVPLAGNASSFGKPSIFEERINHRKSYRVVQKAVFPVCTAGYALTLEGARKMLYYSTRAVTRPVDHAMAQLGYNDLLNAYSVVPALMGQWKIDHGYNSDISDTDENATTGLEVSPDIGQSENVGASSIRKHLGTHYLGYNTTMYF